ncbi:response regulator [Cellulomonas phragmiteti]|uniref:DNA-binding response regulator n=1 Tax=Cellulomonas phragmiteti TaxID=478780 RepID=A0ABQ4DQG4_9CELL|nr:response regulator transcription factor [Cellulomonas phragmiteti]GIG41588.1 DNA-binding response regulator [Cellulomonas phragmiteti]
MSAAPVRVVLVDDQDLLRRSLSMVLDAHPGTTVVGEAGDGAEAIDVVTATSPDVVLMDVRMPHVDGIEATRRLCADPTLAGTRVLMLSMFELDEYVYLALRAGASGFLLKDTDPADLLTAIERTARGESLFAPSILTRLVQHFVQEAPPGAPPAPSALTAREIDVLRLVGRGRSNDEIAGDLTISVKTVKTHITHLLDKLAARDRAQLVIAAYESGLVGARSG